MAAAVESSTSNQRYYCHQCKENILPTIPGYTCPECNLGFIEELSNDSEMHVDESDNGHDLEVPFPMMFHEPRISEIHVGRSVGRRRNVIRNRPGISQDPVGGHLAALDQLLRLFGQDAGNASRVSGEHFGGNVNPGFLNLFHIHGNPGDYVWGGRGLDSIITRLLDQMEGSGPPPADDKQIQSLPTVKITQDDVDMTLECPVCKDVFSLDEEVKKLPCSHCFHESCIIPWLKKHDSCPICRLSLNGSNNPENNRSEEL